MPDDTALLATASHAVRIHHKIEALRATLRETMAVAADLALDAEVDELRRAVVALRSNGVPGRRPLTDELRRAETAPIHLAPGQVYERDATVTCVGWPHDGHFVYLLLDADRHVFYVGETRHPSSRMANHRKRFGARLCRVQVVACRDRADALQLEADLVYHHQPTENAMLRNRRHDRRGAS